MSPQAEARVFLSVCEESADVHAAALVRAARQQGYGWRFYGLTGPRLRALGVETVYDFASHAAMLAGVLGVVGRAYDAWRTVQRSWRAARPDLVVLLDSPELNLRLARLARRLGIPVLYYIAPQTWAARAYRNRQIVRDVDVLACILPFEEEYFQRAAGRRGAGGQNAQGRRFQAEFVGHPLFETLRDERPIPETVEFLRQRAAGRPIVALLPGSRAHVVERMLPLQLEVIRQLRTTGHDVYAAISCAGEERRSQARRILATAAAGRAGFLAAEQKTGGPGGRDLGIDLVAGDNASLLTAADVVLVASGTATLHVAWYRKPMVVMYDAGRLLYWPYRLFGRWVITTPHLSLVNVLAGACVVPEFMPFVRDVAAVATVTRQLLTDTTWRAWMQQQLERVVAPLANSAASARVCQRMAELLARRRAAASQ